MNNKKSSRDYFWPSYVDLMTSLFVVMLVLFIISYVSFSRTNKELLASHKKMEILRQIDSALAKLDTNSFAYDKGSKRHKLKVNLSFKSNSFNFDDIDDDTKSKLDQAGRKLYVLMDFLTQQNKNVNYLMVVEGFAQRNNWNYKTIKDTGYVYSYKRSLALVNFWNSKGLNFSEKLSNCELMIAGSGYFGNRDINEDNNRKFTIQITPKFKIE